MNRLCAALLAAVPFVASAQQTTPPRIETVITGGSVIDVKTGAIRPNQTIAIGGGSIIAITDKPGELLTSGARTIDARGKFVIPGLWDMHMHFGGGDSLIAENRNLIPLFIANGVTTIRDAAGDIPLSVLAWRDSIDKGQMEGPTMFTSGPKLEGPKTIWPGTIEVATRPEVDAALDRLVGLHVDFVKLTDNMLKPELFLYAVGEIKKRGLKSSAHIPQPIAVRDAIDGGLGSIEHMSYAIKAGSPREAELAKTRAAGSIPDRIPAENAMAVFDENIALETYRLMAQRGTAITPTLTISRTLAYLDADDHAKDPYLAYIGPGIRATYKGRIETAARADTAAIARRHRSYEFAKSKVPLLQRAGVLIFAGTDAGFLNSFVYPGFALHEEMELLQSSGLTPLQTLQATTINGARWLGKDSMSATVEAGKVADIVILDSNPLTDVKATRDIRGVMLKGKYFDRAALDAMLADVKKRAATAARP